MIKRKNRPSYGPGFETHIARRGNTWTDVKHFWDNGKFDRSSQH